MKTRFIGLESATNMIEFIYDYSEVAPILEKVYRKTRNRYRIDGFRKGRVPRKIIEARFGKEIFYDDAVSELLEDLDLKPVVEDLDLEITAPASVANYKINEDGGVSITINIPSSPEVHTPEFDLFKQKVSSNTIEVTDEELEQELLHQLIENPKMIRDSEEIGPSDIVEYSAKIYVIEDEITNEAVSKLQTNKYFYNPLDTDSSIGIKDEDLSKLFLGKKIGDKVHFEIEETVPTAKLPELAFTEYDYLLDSDNNENIPAPRYSEEELEVLRKDWPSEKIKIHYVLEIDDFYQLEQAELNDEFAQRMSFEETLDEYKDFLRENMEREKTERELFNLVEQTLQLLFDNSRVCFAPAFLNYTHDEFVKDTENQDVFILLLPLLYVYYDNSKSPEENYLRMLKQEAILEDIASKLNIPLGLEEEMIGLSLLPVTNMLSPDSIERVEDLFTAARLAYLLSVIPREIIQYIRIAELEEKMSQNQAEEDTEVVDAQS